MRIFRFVEVLSLSVIFATCGLGACRKKEVTVTDGAPKPRVVECIKSPRAVFERAWIARATNDAAANLTPIVPGSWPPAGEAVAVLYGYGGGPAERGGAQRDYVTIHSYRSPAR